jgi:DNA-binding CsgD family transcriptional regulator
MGAGIVAAITGDLDAAEQHMIRAIERMTATGASAAWARTQSLLTLAAIAAKRDELAEATRIFGSVYAQAAELGMSTATHAWTSCADGQVDVCRTALGDELFEQLWDQGAALGWEEIVPYLLRGRGARRRPSVGWESLTPTELRVVELVADGRSNKDIAEKLFVSVPTVKSHLTHVYSKLDMRTRTELSAAYARRATSTTSDLET